MDLICFRESAAGKNGEQNSSAPLFLFPKQDAGFSELLASVCSTKRALLVSKPHLLRWTTIAHHLRKFLLMGVRTSSKNIIVLQQYHRGAVFGCKGRNVNQIDKKIFLPENSPTFKFLDSFFEHHAFPVVDRL